MATTKDYSDSKNIFFGKQEGFAIGYNELSGEFKLNEILDMNTKKEKTRSFSNLGKYLFNEGGKRKSPKNTMTELKFEGADFNLVDRNQQSYRVVDFKVPEITNYSEQQMKKFMREVNKDLRDK